MSDDLDALGTIVLFIAIVFVMGTCVGHSCTDEATFECRPEGSYNVKTVTPEQNDVIITTNIPCKTDEQKEKEKQVQAKQIETKETKQPKQSEFGTEFN